MGAKIHPLADFKAGETTWQEAFFPLYVAHGAIGPLIWNSVFKLKTCVEDGAALHQHISDLQDRSREDGFDLGQTMNVFDLYPLQQALLRFESVLSAEFGQTALYVVQKKGGMDTMDLIENAAGHFPSDLMWKAPEAIPDLEQGGRCLAFELHTAAGFHFHRANEAVLRRYYDAVTGGADRPENASMGLYLAKLEELKAGEESVRAALRALVKLHRNPLSHPDHTIANAEEAVGLMSQIRAAIGYMLPAMPLVIEPVPEGAAS
jgi:hypothetical protein